MSTPRLDAGKTGTALVSFVCQRCHQPLRLDHSFANFDQRVYSELTAPLRSSQISQDDDVVDLVAVVPEATIDCDLHEISAQGAQEGDGVSRKYVPPPHCQTSENGNGFTLIGESQPAHSENIGHGLKVTSELFDILSGEGEIDHPLCEECTDTLLDMLDQQLRLTEDECKDYRDFLEKLSSQSDEKNEADIDEELVRLREEEEVLHKQLEAIETERKEIATATDKQRERSKLLDAEQKRFYQEYSEYKRQLLEYEEAQRSVDNQLKYAKLQLDRLKKTNVFNATFHIWHSGHFGTINNFRLGRLPSVPVDWNEINASWGQTVLLLHSLCNKMNLKLERYALVPYGNHSFLESLSDKSRELPLYGSGGFRFFWDTKFDQAMVAFLDCLQQFKEAIEKGNTGFCLPYKMEKGRIEDTSTGTAYSIKIQFNSEEQWTKALKFMLTNLKWGLAYVSSQFANK